MVTHSSNLAWRIPWTEEPGGLHSMGSPRAINTHIYIYHIFFIHSSISGHLGFHLSVIVNNLSGNMGVQISLEILLSILFNIHPEVELLDHIIFLFLAF